MLYNISRSLAILIFKIFFRLEVKGKEHIPKKGGFILASNHLSLLDPIVLGAACPRRLNFMARDNLFSNRLFSWLISNLGAFPVKRNSADSSALKLGIARLKDGKALVIFPEGSRRIDRAPSNVQPGVGFLVAKSNSPIIPSFIKGTDLALSKGAKFIRFQKISVYFGEKILMERSHSDNYQNIAEQIMQGIMHLSEAITYGA